MATAPVPSVWQSRTIMKKPENFSPREEPSWPQNFSPAPQHTLYENPDQNEIVLEVFLDQEPDESDLNIITKAVQDFLGTEIEPLIFAKLKDRDWVKESQQSMKPIKAGRYFVYGAHDANEIPDGVIAIQIEASMAFGTGHHETTKGCLLALDKMADTLTPDLMLDLGCGSGILAFAMNKTWEKAEVSASDIDPAALKIARINADINDCQEIEFIEGNGFAGLGFSGKSFDLIAANILAGPLINLARDIANHTNAGGTVILSGLLEPQGKDVLAAYLDQGFRLQEQFVLNKWLVLVLKKD